MRPGGYLWIGFSLLLGSVGASLLFSSVDHPGPYAEETILLGGVLAGLALASLFFAFKQRGQMKALAEHMGRATRRSRR